MKNKHFLSEYLICSATQEDIPKLVEMRLALQNHMEQSNALLLRYTDEWKNKLPLLYTEMLNNSNVIALKAVSETDNEVVGMMIGIIQKHPQFTIERSAKINDVWVDIEHRHKGICSQMLSDLLDRLAEKGIEHFTLNYVVSNFEAEQTWKALGFKPTIINCVAKTNN